MKHKERRIVEAIIANLSQRPTKEQYRMAQEDAAKSSYQRAYEAVRDWLGFGPEDHVTIVLEPVAHVDTLKDIPLTFKEGRGKPPKLAAPKTAVRVRMVPVKKNAAAAAKPKRKTTK